jgi:fucose 4-O-acetylase-like acetyltransferase
VDRRLFLTYVAIVAVSTLSVTSAIIGVVAVVNGEATAVEQRIPFYVFFMALVFTALVFVLERNLDDGKRILSLSFALAVLAFVIALLGVEGLSYALTNQERVLSNISLYFLSAGLASTGLVYWAVHHWREFVSSPQRRRPP